MPLNLGRYACVQLGRGVFGICILRVGFLLLSNLQWLGHVVFEVFLKKTMVLTFNFSHVFILVSKLFFQKLFK